MTSLDHPDTPTGLDRRTVLRGTAATALGLAFVGSIDAVAGPVASAAPARTAEGYGALVRDPKGLLALPQGFRYEIVTQAGSTRLSDGPEPTPGDPDGTASFATASGATLVNNHEISGSDPNPVPARPGLTFDPGGRGGTTNIEVDRQGRRVREYVSVAGTVNNCAGGKTPWNTWLTCEETEQRLGGALQFDHGFVFEVSPVAAENKGNSPVALKFLGRYAHEAVAVDPGNSTIYLTEDAAGPNGLFYRWTPPQGFRGAKGALKAVAQGPGGDTAGDFEAMSCFDGSRHVLDLSEATEPGTRYRVEWNDIPDRLATAVSTRNQLTPDQVTRSRKLEGAWWGDGGAYFVSSFARTTDGSLIEHDGQVWFYDPRNSTVTLKTRFGRNPNPDQDGNNFDGPDNITVSPYGGVILAEDGEGVQHLVGVTDDGAAYALARNDLNGSEFTGPNFSPDNRVLFANIQSPGYVFAITGPWRRPSTGTPASPGNSGNAGNGNGNAGNGNGNAGNGNGNAGNGNGNAGNGNGRGNRP